jgi:glycosyltransferase involved in cell wall biosynthesis
MKNKRIIISNYDDLKNPVYAGGGAVAIHEVAKRLANKFDITVLTGNYPGARDETIDGVEYRRVGTKHFVGRLAQLLFHATLPFYVLTLKYDVWIESFTPPFSTSFTGLFTRKPVIGLVHMLSGKDMHRKYGIPFNYIENFGLKFYRHFIVLTNHAAEEIRCHQRHADIAVIGNGVYAPLETNVPGSGRYLAYLGRIEVDQKGIDLLLKAYFKIHETCGIPLHIAGSGTAEEMAKLQKRIECHGLKDSIKLVGRVSGEEKAEFLRGALVGVMPSRYEAFSLVMLEMMSYGIPVVAFDIPGIRWAPKDAVVHVPSFDTDKLAASIIKLITDDAFHRTLSQNARAFAETRNWDTVASDYEHYIDKVLAANTRI